MGKYIRALLSKKVFTMLIISLFIVGLIPTTVIGNNEATLENLDQYIKNNIKKLAIPGASVVISHGGQIVYNEVFGEGITRDSRFYIGSISKSFTALAVMQLVEQGKIDLDESVSAYINEFKVSDQITVRHLLHHTSGMTEFDYLPKLPPKASFLDLVNDMNRITLTNEPGKAFSYFNYNYDLLGFIIERTSGKSYQNYMEDHILKPLGLKNTSVRGEVDATGHLSFFGLSIKRTEPFLLYDLPSGYITSTGEDMIRYIEALRGKDPALGISSEGVALMKTGNPYGMGWISSKVANRPAVHHGGSLPGYNANAVILTEDGYSIVYLLNKNHMLKAFFFYHDLTKGIVSILTGEGTPPTRVNYFWIFRLAIVFFILTLIYNIKKIIKMIIKPENLPVKKRVIGAVVNLVIPTALIILLPTLITNMLQRTSTLNTIFLVQPDLIAWFAVGVFSHLVEAMIHLSHLVKYSLDAKKNSA
jgi:CubicO group peptidase (beta-lactamase class C family)